VLLHVRVADVLLDRHALDHARAAEELQRLLACIGQLPPERQRLVLLAYYNGWSREQLAAELATPVNTIKTWLRRSLLELRECLGHG